jgi:hypothetical protein
MNNTRNVRKLIKIIESHSELSFKELKSANPTVEVEYFTFGDFGISSDDFGELFEDINTEFGTELDPDDYDEGTFVETILEELE